MIETLDLGLTHGSASAVAWGGGRFAIVVIQGTRIWSQFLQRDGLREWATLTPPVRIADLGDGEKGADLVWTGSRFVVAWSECLDRTCIGMWTPLTGAGAAAGLAIATDYVYWELFELPLTVTVLDDETLFVHWPAAQGEKAHGRRYRDGVPLDVKPLELGKGVAASLLTAHGLLFTVDAALRISVTPAPATAPLSEPMPLVPLVLTAANEHVLGAAATESEIAVVRTSYRTVWPDGGAVLTVLARDGRLIREVALEAFFAVVASDGRDFALLTVDRDFGMWFQPLGAGGRRVRVGAGSFPTGIQLVWNGSEFVALWHEQAGIRMQRIGADGTLLGGAHPIEGVEGHTPRLTGAGEELLLGWSAGNSGLMMTMRLTNHGEPAGAPEVLTSNGAQLAVASNGRTDLAAAYGLAGWPSAIRVAVREKGSPFTALPSMLPPEAERSGREPVLVAAGSLFVALYDSVGRDRPYAPRTEAALIDERGVILDSEIVAEGDSPYGTYWPYQASKALVPLGNGALLAVYSRMVPEAPYGGTWATFTRVLVLSHGRRRAVGR